MNTTNEVLELLKSKKKSDFQKLQAILVTVSSGELLKLITQKKSEMPAIFAIVYKYSYFIIYVLCLPLIMLLSNYLVFLGLSKFIVNLSGFYINITVFSINLLMCSYPIKNSFLDKSRIRTFIKVLTERNRVEDISVTLYVKSLLYEMSGSFITASESHRELDILLESQAQLSILNGIMIQLTSDDMKRIVQIVRNNSSDTQIRLNLVLIQLIEINGTPAVLPLLKKLLDGLHRQFSSPSKKTLIPATEQCISSIESRENDYRDRDTLLHSCEDSSFLLQASSASTTTEQLLKPSSEQSQTMQLESE